MPKHMPASSQSPTRSYVFKGTYICRSWLPPTYSPVRPRPTATYTGSMSKKACLLQPTVLLTALRRRMKRQHNSEVVREAVRDMAE